MLNKKIKKIFKPKNVVMVKKDEEKDLCVILSLKKCCNLLFYKLKP